MNPMPQLRTVHTRPPVGETVAAQSPDAPTRSAVVGRSAEPAVDLSRVPLPARGLLTGLHAHGLMADAELAKFLVQVGERVRSLTTRETAADALVHFGHITKYVRGRVLAGHLAGLVYGPYRVLDRAGAGTVGVVFLGEHTVLRRRVAVKVLTDGGAAEHDMRERFLNEARVLAGIDHPHVVRAYDAGVARDGGEEFWFLALEWVGGGDLENAVYDRGPVGVAGGCRWGWQAAAGLDAAHRGGLVHRDVKPSNLLLDDAGRLKVADFGLVRNPAVDRTPVNSVVGSLQFLAPEQLNDPSTVGPAADVYGLGVTMFWAMSGRLPRPDGAPSALVAHLRAHEADRLKTVLPDAPAELDDLFARMLSRNPAARPTMAEAMAVFAKYATPTDGGDELGRLEQELAETRKHRDDARRAILKALHAAIDVRTDGGYERAERVGTYTAVIAKHLAQHPNWSGYRSPPARMELAAVAATIDLGDTTPDDREHPARSAAVFDRLAELPTPLPFLRAARDAALSHHERWDGTGWPGGLKGTAIPPVARVIAAADAFERLTNTPTADPAHALAELAKESGKGFDPDVIAAVQSAAEELSALILPVLEVVEEGD